MFQQKLQSLTGQTDVVILPEMFTTGFSMAPAQLAEPMSGPSVQWMLEMAAQLKAAVTGSLIIRNDKGKYYNRLIWAQPDGQFFTYDKRHLFTLADEHRHYEAGRERLMIKWRGWRICPLICYDLRFPVWSRNTEDYDLLMYVANFPARRRQAWQALLPARAIENLAYVIGVNRVGQDGNDIDYAGDSMALDFAGQALCHLTQTEQIHTVTLSRSDLQHFREKMGFLNDRDAFSLHS